MFSEKTIRTIIIILYIMIILFMLTIAVQKAYSQNVVRNGNTFVQVSDSSNKIQKDTPTMTKYFYIGVDGKKYPIYVSSKGKYFIIKTSKKTGKQYKQYLPEVTKQLTK